VSGAPLKSRAFGLGLLALLLEPGCGLLITSADLDARLDADNDGHVATVHGGDDCDDSQASIHPGATELCDGADDDCNGTIDDDAADASTWMQDADGDGYGRPDVTVDSCSAPQGYIALDANPPDCDDGDASINPGAAEVCDGKDQNCNDQSDEGLSGVYYADTDGDSYGDPDVSVDGCPKDETWVSQAGDCADDDAAIHPGATEICGNDIDEDCSDAADACASSNLDTDAVHGTGAIWGDRYGFSVAAADGHVAVGAPSTNGGQAWLLLEPADHGVAANQADLRIADSTVGSELGTDVTLGEDLVGAGTLSLAVGSPGLDAQGAVYVYQALPGASTLGPLDADAIILSLTDSGSLGTSLAVLHDATGDGVADLLVGDPDYGSSYAGAAWLVPGPLDTLVDLDTQAWRLDGTEYGSAAGRAVADAGDINGDGVSDLLIGAPDEGDFDGLVALVLGPVSGDTSLADAALIYPTGPYTLLGLPLAGGGDVDGDGKADIVVGGIGLNRDSFETGTVGRTWLFLDPTVSHPGSTDDAAATLEQIDGGDSADPDDDGVGLSARQDLDGDGKADIVVGYPYRTEAERGRGAVYVVYGGLTGILGLRQADLTYYAGSSDTMVGISVEATDAAHDGTVDLFLGAPGPAGAAGSLYMVPGT